LGYLERDPIRGNDSFEAFEEIFQIAQSNNVLKIRYIYVYGSYLPGRLRPSWRGLVPREQTVTTYAFSLHADSPKVLHGRQRRESRVFE
jgi:hypothetical protein